MYQLDLASQKIDLKRINPLQIKSEIARSINKQKVSYYRIRISFRYKGFLFGKKFTDTCEYFANRLTEFSRTQATSLKCEALGLSLKFTDSNTK